MQPGRAFGEQSLRQGGRHLDADLADGHGVLGDRVQPLGQRRRERRPDSTAKRSIWATFVTGMIPGTIGTWQPAAATRSRSRR